MRRLGGPPVAGITYTDRPGAYGIIFGGNRLLLTEESHPSIDGVEVQLPGGGIDPGESPIAALHREVMEETGYRIAAGRKLVTYQRYCYMPEYDLYARKIVQIYLCRAISRLGAPTEENHSIRWVEAADAVDALSVCSDAIVLQHYLEQTP